MEPYSWPMQRDGDHRSRIMCCVLWCVNTHCDVACLQFWPFLREMWIFVCIVYIIYALPMWSKKNMMNYLIHIIRLLQIMYAIAQWALLIYCQKHMWTVTGVQWVVKRLWMNKDLGFLRLQWRLFFNLLHNVLQRLRSVANAAGVNQPNLMVEKGHKAGMDGLDEEKINRLVEEASKGSKFHAKKKADQARTSEQVWEGCQHLVPKYYTAHCTGQGVVERRLSSFQAGTWHCSSFCWRSSWKVEEGSALG